MTTDPPPLDHVAPTIVVDPGECEPPLPPPSSEPPEAGGIGLDPLLPPDELDELPAPKLRMRAKGPTLRQLQDFFPEFVHCSEVLGGECRVKPHSPQLCALRADQVCDLESLAADLLKGGLPTLEGCATMMDKIDSGCGNLKTPRTKDGHGLLLGAYVHGGSFGVTSYGKLLPWTAMYLNKFLLMKLKETLGEGDYTWSTIALQHASEVPLHKDNHNQRDSRNYVMEIKCDAHAGLWVEDDGDERSVQGGERPADHQWCTA